MKSIEKNTVESKNQVTDAGLFSVNGDPSAPVRVLIVGNSITRHAPKADIGWPNDFGMAASSADKDYVHLLIKALGSRAYVGVRQCAEWERSFDCPGILDSFADCAAFAADLVVFRLGENVRLDADPAVFSAALEEFIGFIAPNGARTVFTTCFWRHDRVDGCVRALAARRGDPVAELGDLGEDDANKAIGLFGHSGVANHPGDRGMKLIAERIGSVLLPLAEKYAKQ